MAEKEEKDSGDGAPTQPKRLIIAVDDHRFILHALECELIEAGYLFEGYTSPDEALKRLATVDSLFAFICDFVFPGGITGDEVIKNFRDICPNTPCIVITGYPTKENVAKLRRVGRIDRIFSKPWNSRELINTLNSYSECTHYISNDRIHNLQRLLLSINSNVFKLHLSVQDLHDLIIDIKTIQLQLKSSRPKATVIVECLDAIRTFIQTTDNHGLADEFECALSAFFHNEYIIPDFFTTGTPEITTKEA